MIAYSKPAQTRDLRENGKIILAHGEVTGHSHQVIAADAHLGQSEMDHSDLYQFFEEPSNFQNRTPARRVLLALAPCVLRHQEHPPIYLDPSDPRQARQGDVYLTPIGLGAWEVRGQSEYTPRRIVRVAD